MARHLDPVLRMPLPGVRGLGMAWSMSDCRPKCHGYSLIDRHVRRVDGTRISKINQIGVEASRASQVAR